MAEPSVVSWIMSRDPSKRADLVTATEDCLLGRAWYGEALSIFMKREKNNSGINQFAAIERISHEIPTKDPRMICGPEDSTTKVLVGPVVQCLSQATGSVWNGQRDILEDTHMSRVVLLMPEEVIEGKQQPVAVNQKILVQYKNYVELVNITNESNSDPNLPPARGWSVAVCGDDNHTVLTLPRSETDDTRVVAVVTTDGIRWDRTIGSEPITEEIEFFEEILEETCPQIPLVKDQHDIKDWNSLRLKYLNGRQVPYGDLCQINTLIDFWKRECGGDEGIIPFTMWIDELLLHGNLTTQRTSGSSKTALGNGTGNTASTTNFTEMAVNDVPFFCTQCGVNHRITLESIEHCITVYLKDCGINPEVNVTEDITMTDFCSGRPAPVGNKLYHVPKLGKYIVRLGWSVSTRRTPLELQGVIYQFWPYRNLPFLGVMIRKMAQLSGAFDHMGIPKSIQMDSLNLEIDLEKYSSRTLPEGILPRDLQYKAYIGTTDDVPAPTSDTWMWVAKVYGLTQNDHEVFVREVSTVTHLPYKLKSDIVRQLVSVDC